MIILTGIFAFFASRILFFLKLVDTTLYLIGSVPAIFIMLYVAYLARWENKASKQQYVETTTKCDYSLKRDFIETLKAKENIAHTLAFLTLVFINSVVAARSVSTPLAIFIIKVVILLLIRGLVFHVFNTVVWCFVHRKWQKSRYGLNITS
ncbi:MAG: hypothetical protein IKY18_03165 [Oscillospiraceae bacterium]|nr:hypothetical protein [Oscillospiraceae bacterium]